MGMGGLPAHGNPPPSSVSPWLMETHTSSLTKGWACRWSSPACSLPSCCLCNSFLLKEVWVRWVNLYSRGYSARKPQYDQYDRPPTSCTPGVEKGLPLTSNVKMFTRHTDSHSASVCLFVFPPLLFRRVFNYFLEIHGGQIWTQLPAP